MEPIKKLRGEHCLNLFISYELKVQLSELAKRYDRTTSDMVRALIKVGIPLFEGLMEAEETVVREYASLFRGSRRAPRARN